MREISTQEFFIEKSQRQRPIGRYRRRLKDNIRLHLRELRYEGVDWIELASFVSR
jgi:hypothetical protein